MSWYFLVFQIIFQQQIIYWIVVAFFSKKLFFISPKIGAQCLDLLLLSLQSPWYTGWRSASCLRLMGRRWRQSLLARLWKPLSSQMRAEAHCGLEKPHPFPRNVPAWGQVGDQCSRHNLFCVQEWVLVQCEPVNLALGQQLKFTTATSSQRIETREMLI